MAKLDEQGLVAEEPRVGFGAQGFMLVKTISDKAVVPTQPFTGVYELYSSEDIEIPPNCNAVVPTGLSIKIPPLISAHIAPLEELAVDNSINVAACVCPLILCPPCYLIEPLNVVMFNHGENAYQVVAGRKIAMLHTEIVADLLVSKSTWD